METTTNTTGEPPDSVVFVEEMIADGIWKYCSFVLISVGTVGNVLAICVLLRPNMRSSTTMFYLTAMAFADIFVLYTGLMRQWLKYVYDIDIRLTSIAVCRVHLFLVYVSLDVAVWTMVIVTVDRAVFVCSPFRAKTVCTLRKARAVLVGMVVIITLINIHFFWIVGINDLEDGDQECDVLTTATPSQRFYAKEFHPWVDFCVSSAIPFSVMLVCNILIIHHIALSRRRLAAHFKREESRVAAGEIPTISRQKSRRFRRSCCSNVTITLLTVNIVFLLTTSPVVAFLLGHDGWHESGSPHDRAVLELVWAIVNMLLYLNNAIHFFLYCLTGPKFRREILAMCRRRNRVDVVIDQSTTLELYHTNMTIRGPK